MSYVTDRYNLKKLSGQSLAVTECGIQICHSGHASPNITYREYSAHFILEGKGEYSVNGKTYSLKAGQGFLITPGANCVYVADKQKPWKYVYVSFSGVDDDTVRDIYAMHSAGKRNEARGYDVTGYFLIVMSRLIKNNLSKREDLTVVETYLKRAKRYVEDNYSFAITVSDIAYNVGLDRTYLYRLFMKRENISPSNYLINFRMKKAVEMLENPLISISEISALVGFNDLTYFYKVFFKKYKITPKKYREKLLIKNGD